MKVNDTIFEFVKLIFKATYSFKLRSADNYMEIKTKKRNADGLVRLETSGNLREIVIKEDFMNARDVSVSLCFRGKNSSGIVGLTLNEVKFLDREVEPKLQMLQNIKVLRFEKNSRAKRKK